MTDGSHGWPSLGMTFSFLRTLLLRLDRVVSAYRHYGRPSLEKDPRLVVRTLFAQPLLLQEGK